MVKKDKFDARYTHCRKVDDQWHEYQPIGDVYGVCITTDLVKDKGWPVHFYIDTAWEKLQYCTVGDFLICPLDGSEFYRIGGPEFDQTYKLKK